MHITERQQAWFNFSQGVALPDPGNIMVAASMVQQ